ncbi:MAG: AAA family ATPase, partial [Chlorobiota bacterium]
MKKRIYLTSDYETLIKNDGYYVDKTRFIPLLENYSNPNVLFLRPRKFGKSLLLSVLEH